MCTLMTLEIMLLIERGWQNPGSEKYCHIRIDDDVLVPLNWASNLLPPLVLLFLVAFLCFFALHFYVTFWQH